MLDFCYVNALKRHGFNWMNLFLKKIYLILTLYCAQSANLTSDSFDRDLDWSERVATKLHRMICSKSRKLNRQLTELNNALESGAKDGNGGEALAGIANMPQSTKERIRARLKELDD